MVTAATDTVVAVFLDRRHAEGAMDALRHRLFREQDIGFVSPTGAGTADQTPTARLEHEAEKGAVAGAVTGGAVGVVAGAVAVGLIPGVGQVLVGGALVGILGAAAAGAALGTYLGPFIGMRHLDDTVAHHVEEQLRGGRTVVTVHAGDRIDEAMDLLHDHGAISVLRPDSTGPDR